VSYVDGDVPWVQGRGLRATRNTQSATKRPDPTHKPYRAQPRANFACDRHDNGGQNVTDVKRPLLLRSLFVVNRCESKSEFFSLSLSL
jgi:hypothetical protein